MASDEPGGHTFGDTPSGEGEMRASLVSLGSSIAEDISPDFGEVPLPNLDATRDSVSAGGVYSAPVSLDVTRTSLDIPPAFDAGYFDDAGTATPLFASPRVHHDPAVQTGNSAKHGRRAGGVPRPPPVTAGGSQASIFVSTAKPPPSPTAVSPSSARASALASSYAGTKHRNESSTKKSFAEKTPSVVIAPRRGGPVYVPPGGLPQDTSAPMLPPTPMFVTPSVAPKQTTTEFPPKTNDTGGFDSDEELSPSSADSVPLPSRRDSRPPLDRGDPARSSANPPLPRENVPTPEIKDKPITSNVLQSSDGDEDDEVTQVVDAIAAEETVGEPVVESIADTEVVDDPIVEESVDPVQTQPTGVPWHLEQIALGADSRTLLLDPETRQIFLPPSHDAPDGRLPTFVGRLTGQGMFHQHKPMCDFFDTLKRFCQTRRVSVAELFRLYDDSAKLSFPRFTKLVRECLLPAVSLPELTYVFAMLDLEGDNSVTPENVETCVRQVAGEIAKGNGKSSLFTPDCMPRRTAPLIVDVLRKVADLAVTSHSGSLVRLFAECAPKTSWTGTSGLLPAVSLPELTYVFAMLDLEGDNSVTPENVETCVRQVAGEIAKGNGKSSLFTPDCMPRRTAPLIVDVLRKVADLAVTSHSGSLVRLFAECAPKTSWTGTSGLDATGVLQLVEKCYPEMIRADSRVVLSSFRMLDLSNDGLVSLQELRRAIRLAVTQKIVLGEGFGKPLDAMDGQQVETKKAVKTETKAKTKQKRSGKEKKSNPSKTKSPLGEKPTTQPKAVPAAVAPSPLKKREELGIRKKLRAERVRLDKKVAMGELFEKDVRGEIIKVEEKLRAAAYEKKLEARRRALAISAAEKDLDEKTKRYRQQQLQEFNAARKQREEEEGELKRLYREEALYSEDLSASLDGVSISDELWSKWRAEEVYAMVDTYGNAEVIKALHALRKDDQGQVEETSVESIAEKLNNLLTAEDETRALDLIEQARIATRMKKEQAEADEEARVQAAWVAQQAAKDAWEAEEAERDYDGEFDADLRLERLRQDRISSEWTGGVEATPPRGAEGTVDRYDSSDGEGEGEHTEPTSMFPSLFSGYPPSPATIGRSPRKFTVDGEPRYAIQPDESKQMYLPRKHVE